ncbi:DUF3080 family protein [Agarivorans sp. MS3-6]
MKLPNLTSLLVAGLTLAASIYVVINWSTPRSDKLFNTYVARLNRVLAINITPPSRSDALVNFAWRDYQLAEPAVSLSLIDTMGLRQCGLDQLVFEKNSSLGKHASADRQLLWHNQIILSLQHCLQNQAISPALTHSLNAILSAKTQAIHTYWNNYLVNEPSLRHLWTTPHTLNAHPVGAYRSMAGYLSSLQNIHQQFVNQQALDSAMLLAISQQLAKGPSILALLQELHNATLWLNTVSKALKQRAFSCRNNQQTFAILSNVLHKVYIPSVQEYLAQLDQSSNVLILQLAPLLDGQTVQTLLEQTKHAHHAFQQANKDHVKQWQRILNSCQG